MRRLQALPAVLACWLAAATGPGLADETPRSAVGESTPKDATAARSGDALTTTPAVACRSIDGYESYEVLPDATLTADEKLLVYYRPLNYRVEKVDGSYHVHLIQDGQIRKRGEKSVRLRKEKLLEYDFRVNSPPNPVYLRNTVALKGLKPGEYEYDIILHDKLAEGPPAVRTLPFRVVAAVLPKAEVDPEPDQPGADPAPKTKVKGKGKRGRAGTPRAQRP